MAGYDPDAMAQLLETLRQTQRPRAGNWVDRARCAEVDPDLFYPEQGGNGREAKRICAGCEVLTECRTEALAADEGFGVWGGLSEPDRRRLKSARSTAA